MFWGTGICYTTFLQFSPLSMHQKVKKQKWKQKDNKFLMKQTAAGNVTSTLPAGNCHRKVSSISATSVNLPHLQVTRCKPFHSPTPILPAPITVVEAMFYLDE
jgi:hypothetical protein